MKRDRKALPLMALFLMVTTIMSPGCTSHNPRLGPYSAAPTADAELTITISGRVVAPYKADSQFAARVIDEATGLDLTGAPLAAATVIIDGTSLTATTDSMGNFTISGAPEGQVLVIIASKAGLSLYKCVSASDEDVTFNMNYQTTTSCLYYLNNPDSLPAGADFDWLDRVTFNWGDLYEAAAIFKTRAQEYGTGETASPPHLDSNYQALIAPGADAVPPYLTGLFFSPSSVSGGATVTVSFTVHDPADITFADIIIQNLDDDDLGTSRPSDQIQNRTLSFTGDPQITRDGNAHTITFSQIAPPALASGVYYVYSIRVIDGGYNEILYTGAQEAELDSYQLNYDQYEYREMNTVTINASIVDITQPELLSVSFDISLVDDATDSVTITITARDSQSDLTTLEYTLSMPNGHSIWSYHDYSASDRDDLSDIYTYQTTYSAEWISSYGTGTIEVSDIYIRDAAFNVLHAESQDIGQLRPPASITTTYVPRAAAQEPDPPDSFATVTTTIEPDPVDIHIDSLSITLEPGTAVSAAVVSAVITAGDNCDDVFLSGYIGVDSVIDNNNTLGEGWFVIYPDYVGATGKWEGSYKLYLNDFLPADSLEFFYIFLKYSPDNSSYYYEVNYYCEEGDCDGLNIQTDALPTTGRGDTAAPALTSVSFSPTTLSAGDTIDFTITASESGSGLKEITIYTSCGDCPSGRDSYSAVIDLIRYSGDGIWTAEFSMPVTSRTASGDWTVSSITVTDFALNYNNYSGAELDSLISDVNSFTVE